MLQNTIYLEKKLDTQILREKGAVGGPKMDNIRRELENTLQNSNIKSNRSL